MATEYVEYDHGGSNSGTIDNPYTTIQSAYTNHTPGNTILVKQGTETLGADVTYSVSGAENAYTIWLVTDDDWNPTIGARYIVDGDGTYKPSTVSATYFKMQGFRFINSSGIGFDAGTSARVLLNDCDAASNVGIGFKLNYYMTVRKCLSINNSYGFYTEGVGTKFLYCLASGASTSGYRIAQGSGSMEGCLAYDCNYGVDIAYAADVNDCTIDDCTVGLSFNSAGQQLSVSKTIISNNATAVLIGAGGSIHANNVAYYNNTAKISKPANYYLMDSTVPDIDLGADPYIDQASRDYKILNSNTDLVGLSTDLDANNTTYDDVGAVKPTRALGVAPTFAGATRLESLSNGSFRLHWAVATGTVTEYKIFAKTSASVFSGGTHIASATAGWTSYDFSLIGDKSPFVSGTKYYIGVRAYNVNAFDTNVIELDLEPLIMSNVIHIKQIAGNI